MLSIIIPAFNEEKTIEETIKTLDQYFTDNGKDFEIIVIDDGSRDQTFEKAAVLSSSHIKVIKSSKNQGKGGALKFGYDHSQGNPVVFFDSGLDFPVEQIQKFIQILNDNNVDVVIGSKRHPQSKVDYPFARRIISFLAQLMVKIFFNLSVRDTQTGLKVFRRQVLEKVMPKMLVKRYAFDIEILALAQHYGFKIIEAPVNLKLKFSTAASPKALWDCFWDTLAVFYRLRILRFYDRSEEERRHMMYLYPRTMIARLFSLLDKLLHR